MHEGLILRKSNRAAFGFVCNRLWEMVHFGREMRQADIVIAGAGLAGSTTAAMLTRKGYDVVVADPPTVYPPDLRCEKLEQNKIDIIQKTGLADAVFPHTTLDRSLWVARAGHVLEKRDSVQWGILYDRHVNTIRAEIPEQAFTAAKVMSMTTSADRQTVTLSNGEQISTRLLVLANGLNVGLSHKLGHVRPPAPASARP